MNKCLRLFAPLCLCTFVILSSASAQEKPAAKPAGAMPADPNLPTLWLVGDSTVRNGSGKGGNGQWGWGDRIAKYFDTSKINVVNRAIGGRSSRSYINEGRWDSVLASAKKGDFVMIQMGHNDGGPLAGDNRERGSIRGTGEETQEVTLALGDRKGQKETVHTYGWYLRKYIKDARDHGLTPIICSPIPHRPKEVVKPDDVEKSNYVKWSEEVAKQKNTLFIPLNKIALSHYVGMTPEELKEKYFTKADDTHTSAAGADVNAQSVVEGLKQLDNDPLAQYLK